MVPIKPKYKWFILLGLFLALGLITIAVSLLIYSTAVENPLWGSEWTLETLNGHGLAPKTIITMRVESWPESRISGLHGSSGCNSYGYFRVLENGRISKPDKPPTIEGQEFVYGFTVLGCLVDGKSDVMDQEKEYLDALDHQAASYKLVNDRLEMYDVEGNPVLIFRKGP